MTLPTELAKHLDSPRCEAQDIFDAGRFPNLTVSREGHVVATWGDTELVSRRSTDGGAAWEPPVAIGPGLQAGGTLVDEATGDLLAFVHPEHPPSDGDRKRFAERTMYRSTDAAQSWRAEDATYHPDANGHVPALHYAEHGITIEHGPHAGRLLRPARVYGKADGYNTTIFSDDHGRTWHASDPFPLLGTGEGAVAERSDGTVYYSSRKHFFTDGEQWRPERPWAISRDGGQTWKGGEYHRNLPDGPRYRGAERRAACWNGHFGMAGGLTRLPLPDRDIFVYSNADQPEHTRHRMCLWASFDGGETWPIKRLLDEGPAAYSSLIAGRPGTPSEGWVYLLFERWQDRPCAIGHDSLGHLVRFKLAWLLAGETTGDGTLPHGLVAG
ncbi:MAG: exo-alpha-sialidase [Phycisphaeraceae bacterium]